jgi:hypothetical protein
MTPQPPAQGILLNRDNGDYVQYTAICQCGNEDDSHSIFIEADEYDVTVNIYTTPNTDNWTEIWKKDWEGDHSFLRRIDHTWKDFWNGLYRRVTFTWEMWVNGTVKHQSTIVMDEQQALNYAEALKKSVEDVKNFRSKNGRA